MHDIAMSMPQINVDDNEFDDSQVIDMNVHWIQRQKMIVTMKGQDMLTALTYIMTLMILVKETET